MGGVDAAAGLNAGCGAEVQYCVVVWLTSGEAVDVSVSKVLVERVMGILNAHWGMDTVVQACEPEAGTSDAHPSQRVHAHVVPGIDLCQELGSQVLGQWRELGIQDNIIQLFGQQFAVQVYVGTVPKEGRQPDLSVTIQPTYEECPSSNT